MELDPSSPLASNAHPGDGEGVGPDPMDPVKMEEDKEIGIKGRLEEEEEEEGGEPLGRLTSSRMGNVSATESSRMFVSLLTEGSSMRYDSSMQVGVRQSYFVFFRFYYAFNLLIRIHSSCSFPPDNVCLKEYL